MRVPYGNFIPFKIPEKSEVPDESLVLLADAATTTFWSVENAGVKKGDNLVFFEPASDISVVTNDRLNYILRSILKRINIKPFIIVHGLRHTHSSILFYKGISILYVSEHLGHSNIDITTSTYAHVLKELRERESTD